MAYTEALNFDSNSAPPTPPYNSLKRECLRRLLANTNHTQFIRQRINDNSTLPLAQGIIESTFQFLHSLHNTDHALAELKKATGELQNAHVQTVATLDLLLATAVRM